MLYRIPPEAVPQPIAEGSPCSLIVVGLIAACVVAFVYLLYPR